MLYHTFPNAIKVRYLVPSSQKFDTNDVSVPKDVGALTIPLLP